MADDKPTLTRRRVLGGMATIGLAAGAGGATWARMQDTENGNVTIAAGVLDLEVGGSEPFNVNIGPVRNGENYTEKTEIRNTGNIDGTWMSITYPEAFNQRENGLEEPERDLGDTNDDGELVQYMQTEVSVEQKTESGNINESFTGVEQLVPLADCEGETFYLELPQPLPRDGVDNLRVQHKVFDEDISDAMGDSINYELDVTLYDEDPR